MCRGRRSGFTLVEAMISIVFLTVGIVGTLHGLSAISQTEAHAQEREHMQRLALEKYDELVSTGQATQSGLSGDFSDRNETGYTWQTDLETTSVTNLSSFSVTVLKGTAYNDPKFTYMGLLYVPPTTSTTTTAAGPTTGGTTP